MAINAVFNEIKSEHNLDFNLKSEQSEILELLVEKKSVVATLRTGFGKSLIFMMLPKILDKVRTQFTIFRQAKRGVVYVYCITQYPLMTATAIRSI